MDDFTIASETGKGRSFSGIVLTAVLADGLWSGSGGENVRPAMVAFASGPGEIRALEANFRMGKKAHFPGNPDWVPGRNSNMEFLKSAGYTWSRQVYPEGTLITTYLPDLFRMDLGMVDPQEIKFCLLPPASWIARQETGLDQVIAWGRTWGGLRFEGKVGDDLFAYLARVAPLFMAYLSRRTRCPLLKDRRFYFQVLLACLDKSLASLSLPEARSYRHTPTWGVNPGHGFKVVRPELLGYSPGLSFMSDHDSFEALLAEETNVFLNSVKSA